MKLTKILILSLGMALCAAGGVGTALAAITKTPASSSNTSTSFDKSIILYWDSGSSTKSFADMEELATDVPQYRHLVVSPKSSASVSGTVTVSFALGYGDAPAGKTATTKGVTVTVYEISNEATDLNFETYVASGTQKCVINSPTGETASGNATFTVSTDSVVHETVKHYAIKVVYDGSQPGDGKALAAQLVISQSFAA